MLLLFCDWGSDVHVIVVTDGSRILGLVSYLSFLTVLHLSIYLYPCILLTTTILLLLIPLLLPSLLSGRPGCTRHGHPHRQARSVLRRW